MDIWDPSIPSEASAYNWLEAARLEAAEEQLIGNYPLTIDLFSGCGGISEGFRSAGFRSALAIDIHEPSIRTLRHNHRDTTTLLGDIRAIKKPTLLEALGGRKITALVGGAPCQGFSLCNRKHFDDDPRNTLFLEYMRIIKLVKPEFVLFENVQNIRSVADGRFVHLIAEHFEDLGYSITSGVIDATEFGVPQKRKRLLFLGRLGKHTVPWPVGQYRGLASLTVRDAIGDLPELGNDELVTEYRNAEPESAYQLEMRTGASRLFNHQAPNHPQETIERIGNTLPGKPLYESFKQRIRLSWDAPSPTQVCGGIRPQFQFGHPGQPRGLSIRERARIQSFPDRYEFLGGVVMGRVQTGNAVPPRVAAAFARAMMNMITGEKHVEVTCPVEQTQFVYA